MKEQKDWQGRRGGEGMAKEVKDEVQERATGSEG